MYEHLGHYQSEDSHAHQVLIQPSPPSNKKEKRKLLIIESRMIIIFWYAFLKPHLTAYYSNMGVLIRNVIELGTSTLDVTLVLLYVDGSTMAELRLPICHINSIMSFGQYFCDTW